MSIPAWIDALCADLRRARDAGSSEGHLQTMVQDTLCQVHDALTIKVKVRGGNVVWVENLPRHYAVEVEILEEE